MACGGEGELKGSERDSGFEHGESLQWFERGSRVDDGVRVTTLEKSGAILVDHTEDTVVEGFDVTIADQLSNDSGVAGLQPVGVHGSTGKPALRP